MEITGIEIKDFRKKYDISQSSMASLLGVSLRTVQNYEKGSVIPKSKYEIILNVFQNYESGVTEKVEFIGKNNKIEIKKFVDLFLRYEEEIIQDQRMIDRDEKIREKAISEYQHKLLLETLSKGNGSNNNS